MSKWENPDPEHENTNMYMGANRYDSDHPCKLHKCAQRKFSNGQWGHWLGDGSWCNDGKINSAVDVTLKYPNLEKY